MKTRKGFYFQCGYFFGCRFNISWFGCYFWHFPDVSINITLAKVCVLNFANFHSEFLEGPYGPVPYFGPVTEKTLSCEFILFAIQIAIYNKKVIFFLRIPSTIRHERVRPVLSPTQPGYRARKSQSMKTEVLYTLYLPFCLNFEYFFRKLRDIFFARLLQPLKYLSYFDYYYFLWLISLSTFWLICATPLISKNYAVKFF